MTQARDLEDRLHAVDDPRERRPLIDYEEFQAEVRRRKRERWAKILESERPGRPAGRRPRDPEKERLLTTLDRARLERENPQLLRPKS